MEHVHWPPKRLGASTLQKQYQFLIMEIALWRRPEVRSAEEHRRKKVCQVQQSDGLVSKLIDMCDQGLAESIYSTCVCTTECTYIYCSNVYGAVCTSKYVINIVCGCNYICWSLELEQHKVKIMGGVIMDVAVGCQGQYPTNKLQFPDKTAFALTVYTQTLKFIPPA